MVRRCVHRATGNEFAVKIMEVTAERLSPEQLEEVREATRRETHILRQVAGHPHISEAAFPTPVSWPCPQPTSPDRHCLWASPPPSLPALTAPHRAASLWVPPASFSVPSRPVSVHCCLTVEGGSCPLLSISASLPLSPVTLIDSYESSSFMFLVFDL